MLEKLNAFMVKLRKQNPNANWANLLTGVAVLVMVAVFSYAYFTRAHATNTVTNQAGSSEEVTTPQQPETNEPAVTDQGSSSQEQPVPATPEAGTTVVQHGEGLWQVAQRVCGDGEKYNVLANANGLSVWDGLNEGMTLKVVCN